MIPAVFVILSACFEAVLSKGSVDLTDAAAGICTLLAGRVARTGRTAAAVGTTMGTDVAAAGTTDVSCVSIADSGSAAKGSRICYKMSTRSIHTI